MLIGQVALRPTCATVRGGDIRWRWRRRRRGGFLVAATANKKQNHYTVLGVSHSASSSDIKKAFRLLARKWHPDVSKDSQAEEVFKSIHLAYEVLSDEVTRIQYDRVLKSHEYTTEPTRGNIYHNFETEDEVTIHNWNEWQKMRRESFRKRYYAAKDEQSKTKTSVDERSSLMEVLRSVFLSVLLMNTVGCRLSLMYSTLTSWLDGKLDNGYKLGHLIAWVLGGKGGVLLSCCLSVASWACGKNSSSTVSLMIVAMWVGSNILIYAPIPQGALLALLYMSVKLQGDLKF